MYRLQLRVVLTRLTFKVHLPEHVQGRFFACLAHARPALRLHRPHDLPALLIAAEPIGLAILRELVAVLL